MNVYVCSVCGHIEFIQPIKSCAICNSPATVFNRNDQLFVESAEKSKEAAIKHIPAVTINKQCGLIPDQSCVDVVVKIGEVLHPMESEHFIRFIDCYVNSKYVARVSLTPGVFAAGCFHLKPVGGKVVIVENCSIHGYWKTEATL